MISSQDLHQPNPGERACTKYKAYTLSNFRQIPQIHRLSEEQIFAIEAVGQVLPFKVNNYVTEELIDWENIPDDPLFILNFPQKGMLTPLHFEKMAKLLKNGANPGEIRETAKAIYYDLNPHPAGQLEYNLPILEGEKFWGMQHKYRETALVFPSQGQTCFAYCTFCFRWPQFIGLNELKFAMQDPHQLIRYLRRHPEITDVLFTGGDPLIMNARALASYITPLLEADLPNLTNIRIGTKTIGNWPYRFISHNDAGDLLSLFGTIIHTGKHLAIMAHFNHPRELETWAARQAIALIRQTGAEIRTQSPLLAHVNDQPEAWAKMWKEQVRLGCVPYYMFVVRDTGTQDYFSIPLVQAWHIFREAYQQVSGIARTVHGPCMSSNPGKVHVLGVNDIKGEKVFALQFLQGRNPDWVLRPFFAQYDEKAIWLDDLKPAFGDRTFFFQEIR
jgi:KamA family protein